MVNRVSSLREAVAFDAPVQSADDMGGVETGWGDPVDAYECRAAFVHLRGSEAVEAARLAGREVYRVKIRQSAAARAVTTDWRMRDTRRGTVFNIRSVDAVTDPAFIWITVESGVAV